MFQTELNHFLQSYATDGLTAFMQFVSALGYTPFFTGFLLVLMFSINFKKGFILFMVLLWTGVITYVFKDYYDLPRPFHVDNSLLFLDGQLPDDSNFSLIQRGAMKFWDPLPVDVVQITRSSGVIENGFPSGHSSVAIAFWGALILLYRKKWIAFIALLLMILIPLSRLYLGVHFLADVLGGIFLGALMLGFFYLIILKENKLKSFLNASRFEIGINKITFLLLGAPLPFLLMLSPRGYLMVAILVGIGLGFLLVAKKGLPINNGPVLKRFGRLLSSVGLALVVGLVTQQITRFMNLNDNPWTDAFIVLIVFITLIWQGVEVNIRMGLFQREQSGIYS